MKAALFLIISALSLNALASVDQRLANKQWTYYGQEFYQGPLTVETLSRILNGSHFSQDGKLDLIGGNCGAPNCYKQVSVGYDKARTILFGEIYKLKDAQGTYVKDVYCGKNFYFKNADATGSMHTEINIEHTWPQSKFSPRFEKNFQKSDMHHLYLTDSDANNQRGNHEFGDLTNQATQLNVQDCGISKLGTINGDLVFMPPVAHRGNVARSLFYFAVHYNMTISQTQEKTLRQWHKADPVDANEIARHELIAKHQKVRNPFVDYPELTDKISDF